MQRNIVIIEGRDFLLSQHTDMVALKSAAQQAVRDGAGFVDFVVVGNQQISILISPGVAVLFESQTVDYDERDTGDTDEPFDPDDGEPDSDGGAQPDPVDSEPST